MNVRSLFFAFAALLMACSTTEARIGEDVADDNNSAPEHARRGLNSARYDDWPTRCCGQNDNQDCLCPLRRFASSVGATRWADKCAEKGVPDTTTIDEEESGFGGLGGLFGGN